MWTLRIIIVILLAVLYPHIHRYLNFMGYHRTTSANLHPGKCTRIAGVENGSEDVEILPGGLALITSGLRLTVRDDGSIKGRILIVDLNQQEPKADEIPIKSEQNFNRDDFNPLGMTKWIDGKGKTTIFVVNMDSGFQKSTVEKFHFSEEETTLYHLETVRNDNFTSLNDIAAISENQFYYTNFFGRYPNWEMPYKLAWAETGFYNGRNTVVTDEGLAGPNGIILSSDGKYVYMNVYISRFMRSYKRLPDNSLQHVQDYPLPISGDNMAVDEDGNVWNAGHPCGWRVMENMQGRDTLVPSQVVRLTMKDGKVTSSRDVFNDDGRLHSVGSVAVPYKNKLFLGTALGVATLCEMDHKL